MSDDLTITPERYTHIKYGTTCYRVPDSGYLNISGDDPIPFLQRQTTNDLRVLQPGRTQITVLTSPTARILDVLTVFYAAEAQSESTLGVLTLPQRAAKTEQYLKSRIFFMDRVQIQNRSLEYVQLELNGSSIHELLLHNGLTTLPEIDHIVFHHFGNTPFYMIGQTGFSGKSYRILIATEAVTAFMHWLREVGVEIITPTEWNLLRIEAGLPGAGEMNEEFTPLEAGLSQFIAENKGCYTGQEVLARQITYDKITRKLVGLRTDDLVQTGDPVALEDKPVGKVTSAAFSPRFGPIALAVIRRPYFKSGTQLWVPSPQGNISAQVSDLPFTG